MFVEMEVKCAICCHGYIRVVGRIENTAEFLYSNISILEITGFIFVTTYNLEIIKFVYLIT